MKYILLFLSMIALTAFAKSEDYLKVKTYPSYPLPGNGIESSIEIRVKPSYPQDVMFDQIFNELNVISSNLSSKSVAVDEGYISFEMEYGGKHVEVTYSKSALRNSKELSARWDKIFALVKQAINTKLTL